MLLFGETLLKGPAFVQETVCPLVVQVLPFDVKFAGALMPVGNVIVVVIGPFAGPEP